MQINYLHAFIRTKDNKSLIVLLMSRSTLDLKQNYYYDIIYFYLSIEPAPNFVSLNLGLFICIKCSGHHRALGTRFSVTKSVLLDTFDDTKVKVNIKQILDENYLVSL